MRSFASDKKALGEKWWRYIFFADFEKGIRIKYGGAKEHEHLLGLQETAAWIYEVARRLPDVKEGRFRILDYERWPTFWALPLAAKLVLVRMVEDRLGWRAVFRTAKENNNPRKTGYSDAFPRYSFDLLSDNAPAIRFFTEWLEEQRAQHGIVRPKGKTKKNAGQVSHGKRDLPKQPNWRTVEFLDHEKGKGDPLDDSVRKRCSSARALGTKFLPLIVDVLNGSYPDPDLPGLLQWFDI